MLKYWIWVRFDSDSIPIRIVLAGRSSVPSRSFHAPQYPRAAGGTVACGTRGTTVSEKPAYRIFANGDRFRKTRR